MSKYNNQKYGGFDSKKEYKRYNELLLLQKSGQIQDLQTQVKFVLIPSQYEVIGVTRSGKEIRRCIERECSYIADFVYTMNGEMVVEDTKGFKTKDYIIKRKLMLQKGIKITEV